MKWVIATEDLPSEAVAERLVEQTGGTIDLRFGEKGNGYLRANMGKFRQLAVRHPTLILPDLDQTPCAPELRAKWQLGPELPERLSFRVVVREIESWLLADQVGISNFLGVSAARITVRPDEIRDPKAELLKLVSKSTREMKADLLPARSASARVGVNYNARLVQFVRNVWSPERACVNSPSLARARKNICEIAARLRSDS
ncbi:hypothetical protein C7S18_14325 [Ahniella affigens]|uniref:DUF4276 domain-containing protein n=1 Tax=Ahniella affigens TaxID=2021234 RepID=A0A2P1PTX7_9GAMM|nr:hypothetical protein C7S18_14325 [Ahniella affigens]